MYLVYAKCFVARYKLDGMVENMVAMETATIVLCRKININFGTTCTFDTPVVYLHSRAYQSILKIQGIVFFSF
jgi:hypothetical protein